MCRIEQYLISYKKGFILHKNTPPHMLHGCIFECHYDNTGESVAYYLILPNKKKYQLESTQVHNILFDYSVKIVYSKTKTQEYYK